MEPRWKTPTFQKIRPEKPDMTKAEIREEWGKPFWLECYVQRDLSEELKAEIQKRVQAFDKEISELIGSRGVRRL